MTTFALVHGAGTVGASWAPVALLLGNHGHRVVAPDLPMADPDATFSDYARVVLDAIDDEDGDGDDGDDGDLVVVGHSMGGMVVALIAAGRPVRATAYVAALVPEPGRTLADQLRSEPIFTPAMADAMARGGDGLLHWTPAAASALLLDELEPARAEQALRSLRGHARAPYKAACPLDALPDVPATYVVCREDRVVSPAWGRDTAAPRLRAELVELAGGHMPMLARPRELATLLLRLT